MGWVYAGAGEWVRSGRPDALIPALSPRERRKPAPGRVTSGIRPLTIIGDNTYTDSAETRRFFRRILHARHIPRYSSPRGSQPKQRDWCFVLYVVVLSSDNHRPFSSQRSVVVASESAMRQMPFRVAIIDNKHGHHAAIDRFTRQPVAVVIVIGGCAHGFGRLLRHE